MENTQISRLAKRLNLTDPEPEEFILTDQESELAIAGSIELAKKHKAWSFTQKGFSEMEVLKKLSEIDWGKEIDKHRVLSFANSCKHQNIWHEENRKRENELEKQKQADLVSRCDAKYMFKLMKWTSQNIYGKELVVNEHNKRLITAICFFLSRDKRLETELGFSLKKGLLIRGISGLGKTYLLKCLENNELNPVNILSMIEISDEIKEKGEYEIKGGKVIYLDDVGTEEPTVNYFGTKINFFKQFVELTYLNKKSFENLIVSTNNSFSEIEEKYGFRVRSRIKDMFNILDVSGKDMRGQ